MITSHRQEVVALVVECQTPLSKNLGTDIGLSVVPASSGDHVTFGSSIADKVDLIIVVIEEKLLLLTIVEGAGRIATRVPFVILRFLSISHRREGVIEAYHDGDVQCITIRNAQ